VARGVRCSRRPDPDPVEDPGRRSAVVDNHPLVHRLLRSGHPQRPGRRVPRPGRRGHGTAVDRHGAGRRGVLELDRPRSRPLSRAIGAARLIAAPTIWSSSTPDSATVAAILAMLASTVCVPVSASWPRGSWIQRSARTLRDRSPTATATWRTPTSIAMATPAERSRESSGAGRPDAPVGSRRSTTSPAASSSPTTADTVARDRFVRSARSARVILQWRRSSVTMRARSAARSAVLVGWTGRLTRHPLRRLRPRTGRPRRRPKSCSAPGTTMACVTGCVHTSTAPLRFCRTRPRPPRPRRAARPVSHT